MNEDMRQKIQKILDVHQIMTIATNRSDGWPQATTVDYANEGMALYFLKVNPIKALYWTAIINGMLAPFLLVAIVLVASDAGVMKKQPSSLAARICVGVTALIMFAAAAGMFIF